MYALCVLPVNFRSLLHWVFAAQFFHSLEIASNQSIFTTFQRKVIHRVARNVLKKYFFYMFCCAVFMYATCAWYFSNSPIRAHAKWKPCETCFVHPWKCCIHFSMLFAEKRWKPGIPHSISHWSACGWNTDVHGSHIGNPDALKHMHSTSKYSRIYSSDVWLHYQRYGCPSDD